MALLRLMNFDRSTVFSDFLSDYANVNFSGNAAVSAGGAFGANALTLNSHDDQYNSVLQACPVIPAGTLGILGVRIKNSPSGGTHFGIMDPSGGCHINVQITPTGQINVYQGATATLLPRGYVASPFAANLYSGVIGQVAIGTNNYFQIKYAISAIAGSVTLLLNGVVLCALTGINTKGAASSDSAVGGYTLAGFGSFQDIYVADGTGPAPYNTFLGDLRVYLARPTGNGALTQFTPVGAATNWQVAATSPLAAATIYNTANAVGSTDLYTAAPLPLAITTILGVQIEAQMLKSDAGPRTATMEIKSGAAVAVGASHSLSVSVANYTDIFVADPATNAAFTVAGVNVLQFGPTILT